MIRTVSISHTALRRLLLIGDNRQFVEIAALLSVRNHSMVVVCDAAYMMVGAVNRSDVIRRMRHCQVVSVRPLA